MGVSSLLPSPLFFKWPNFPHRCWGLMGERQVEKVKASFWGGGDREGRGRERAWRGEGTLPREARGAAEEVAEGPRPRGERPGQTEDRVTSWWGQT